MNNKNRNREKRERKKAKNKSQLQILHSMKALLRTVFLHQEGKVRAMLNVLGSFAF